MRIFELSCIAVRTGPGSGGAVTSLIKAGTGTLTLAGATTYTGGTTVSAGMLYVTATSGTPLANTAISVSNAGSTFAVTLEDAASDPHLGTRTRATFTSRIALAGGMHRTRTHARRSIVCPRCTRAAPR